MPTALKFVAYVLGFISAVVLVVVRDGFKDDAMITGPIGAISFVAIIYVTLRDLLAEVDGDQEADESAPSSTSRLNPIQNPNGANNGIDPTVKSLHTKTSLREHPGKGNLRVLKMREDA